MLLELGYPHIDLIKLYIPAPGNRFIEKIAGDSFPFSHRKIKHRNFLFNISIPPEKEETYYFRFETEGTMQFPIEVWQPTVFIQHVNNEIYILGLYFGILLSMILYNLFIYVSVREKSNFYYVMFVVGALFTLMCLNGLAYEYLWPNSSWWTNRNISFFSAFTSLAMLQFTAEYINTKQNTPILHKIIQVFSGISILVMVLALLLKYSVSIKMGALLPILMSVLVMTAGGVCVKKRIRAAYFFMLAWTALLLGIFVFSMRGYGALPSNFITDWGLNIGSALSVVLLSLGLADRNKFNEK